MLSRWLKVERAKRGATQAQAEIDAGLPAGTIAQLESGRRSPTLSHAVALANWAEITLDDVVALLDSRDD